VPSELKNCTERLTISAMMLSCTARLWSGGVPFPPTAA
jgi:hypothetical protein